MKSRALIVIGLVLGSLLSAPLVMAQNDPRATLREAREAREQSRAEQAELARQIDVLLATDEELVAALEALSAEVAAQEREIDLARTAVDDAIAAEAAVRQRIHETRNEADRLRTIASDRAVAAYIAPRDASSNERDITMLARREALFRYVDLDGRDLLDQLRAVEDDLDRLELEAAGHRADAVRLRSELEAALTRLEADVAAQQAIRAELAELVEHLDAEITAMEASEAEINSIIRDSQRQIAREEAIARAAARAATSTTTTTTTTAPPDPGETDTSSTSDAPSTAATTTTAPVDQAAPIADIGLIWPTTGSVTSAFGTRVHPITGSTRHHAGLDIGNNAGTSIWAAQSGTVIFSGRMSGFGETVIISHNSRVTTLYAHMSARSVAKGTSIGQGQEVGKMGSTGFSTGNHLHLEVRVDGTAVDPRLHLP